MEPSLANLQQHPVRSFKPSWLGEAQDNCKAKPDWTTVDIGLKLEIKIQISEVEISAKIQNLENNGREKLIE